ncbi:MAG: hypothetical protein WC400_01510 [Patescibacteria group bacterium]|jgi:hypothetical protein
MNVFHLLGGLVAAVLISSGYVAAPVVPVDPRLAPLEQFLAEKGSPLPAEELLKYDNWRTIVALSCAESGYGKNMAGTWNAWGIKDFTPGSPKFDKTRDFTSWAESIKYTSELLYKYDEVDGEPKAVEMVYNWKYVLPYNHWVGNVNYSLWEINQAVPVVAA